MVDLPVVTAEKIDRSGIRLAWRIAIRWNCASGEGVRAVDRSVEGQSP